MMKKIVLGCLISTFLFSFQRVNAASTCEYSEQVELSNIVSTIQAGYDISDVVMDMNGNVASGVNVEDVTEYSDYFLLKRLNVHVNNMTDDVYIKVTSDHGFDRTYHFSDVIDGNISFDGGDLSEIINYKAEIFSNKANCKDELIRSIDFVTPMKNSYAFYGECEAIPNFEYCQPYITVPFLVSDSNIAQSISNAYIKHLDNMKEEEEEKNKGFFEKIGDFLVKNKIAIYSILGVMVVAGVLVTIIIIKKRRGRVL